MLFLFVYNFKTASSKSFEVFKNNWMKQPDSMRITKVILIRIGEKTKAEVHYANDKMKSFDWGVYTHRTEILSKVDADTLFIDKRVS